VIIPILQVKLEYTCTSSLINPSSAIHSLCAWSDFEASGIATHKVSRSAVLVHCCLWLGHMPAIAHWAGASTPAGDTPYIGDESCMEFVRIHLEYIMLILLQPILIEYHYVADSYDEHFSRTIATLPLLDLINDIHSKKLNNMTVTSPDVKFPPLHDGVFPKKENI